MVKIMRKIGYKITDIMHSWLKLLFAFFSFYNIQSILQKRKNLIMILNIRTEYGEIRSISPYLIQISENTEHKNSEYEHFSRSMSASMQK